MTQDESHLCEAIADISLGPIEARWNTVDLCKHILSDAIPGDMVEAGVFGGTHPIIMSCMGKKYGQPRKVHLFDSFKGIPKVLASEHPHDIKNYGLRAEGEPITSSGVSVCGRDGVEAYTKQFGGDGSVMVFHEGWFQDTMPGNTIEEIALLRVDADLVESLNLCLTHLYPKVVSGGWFVCDDYLSPTCKEVIDKFMEAHKITGAEVIGPERSIIYWKVK